ncbi:MAG TPA: hypothetical protein VMW27_02525 [Thermoanaerobaculia bacterium]|nr:hypothetical protein [Thermoanaerobaculia bacterium]
MAVLVGLLGPLLVRLAWQLIKRVRPRPGSEAFAPDDRTGLRRAFEVDRAVIAAAMVPPIFLPPSRPPARGRSTSEMRL